MLGFLGSDPFQHPTLGTFERKGGQWRGTGTLLGARAEFRLAGDRKAPSPAALAIAEQLGAWVSASRDTLARELFAHYEPMREAHTEGGFEGELPAIEAAGGVWPHVTVVHAVVDPAQRGFSVEIHLGVAWDDDHTLGARYLDGVLVELNGSV